MNTRNRLCARTFCIFGVAALFAACGGGGSGGDGGGTGGDPGGGGGGSPPTFTIGGTVTGLSGMVVLSNNGGNELPVSANGAFAFGAAVPRGAAYSVSVQAQPSYPAQDCVVTNGSGTATANVTSVAVACSALSGAELLADASVRSTKLSWANPSGASSFNVFVSSARDCDIFNYASCPNAALIMTLSPPHDPRAAQRKANIANQCSGSFRKEG